MTFQIDTDKAGMAIGRFVFSVERCSVTACISMDYSPYYFFSKYPERKDPIWNLVNLLSPLIWGLVVISIILVILMFKMSSFIYTKLGHRKSIMTEEMVLIPIR